MNDLRLNKDLYDKTSIAKAAAAFKELAEIQINENINYYICTFLNCRYSIAETKKEFENYLIDLMNTEAKTYDAC